MNKTIAKPGVNEEVRIVFVNYASKDVVDDEAQVVVLGPSYDVGIAV